MPAAAASGSSDTFSDFIPVSWEEAARAPLQSWWWMSRRETTAVLKALGYTGTTASAFQRAAWVVVGEGGDVAAGN